MTADQPPTPPTAVAGPCASWPADKGEGIRQIVERAGDKWTVLVIGALELGPLRYTELQGLVPGISQRMLTRTLQHLRRDGMVTRTAYAEVPPRVVYELTDLGRALIEAVTVLVDWAGRHHDQIQHNRAAFDHESDT